MLFVLFFLREQSAFQRWLLWSSGLGFLAKKGKDAAKQSSTDLDLKSGCSACVHMYIILVCICVVLNCTTGSQQHACQIVSAVLGVLSVSIKT